MFMASSPSLYDRCGSAIRNACPSLNLFNLVVEMLWNGEMPYLTCIFENWSDKCEVDRHNILWWRPRTLENSQCIQPFTGFGADYIYMGVPSLIRGYSYTKEFKVVNNVDFGSS